MPLRIRALRWPLSAAIALAAFALPSGTAQAASWYSDPNSCTSTYTRATKVVSGRTVELRYGLCGGKRHFWGRITGYDSNKPDHIRFEVDRNAEAPIDGVSWYRASNRNYTAAYPDEPGFFFRACYVTSSSGTCNDSNSTGWDW